MTDDTLRLLVLLATASITFAATRVPAAGKPLHLLFWQPKDIRDGQTVTFRAHPFTDAEQTVLIPSDPGRPSIWYAPAAAVPAGDEVRVYYQRINRDEQDYLDQRTLCVGMLRDDTFELPDLGIHPQSWDGPRNVVLRRSFRPATWGGFNVFQMVSDAGGHRLLYWDQPEEGPAGGMVATSRDGIHWTKDDRPTAVFAEHNDAFTLAPSPAGGEYLLYQTRLEPWPNKPIPDNLRDSRRVISLRRSPDLAMWTPQDTILRPDEQDGLTAEFYLLKVFYHRDRYVGLAMKYFADPQTPGKHSGITRHELMLSTDGVKWERPYRYTDMGVWSYVTPFENGGSLCLVAGLGTGWRGVALYRVRHDGLASCGADGAGSFCTPQFTMPDSGLTLNADCRGGSIGVEALDEKATVIDGFSAGDCRLADADGTHLPLRWGGTSAAELAGKKVQLRLLLEHARVFSLSSAAQEAESTK
jgi:hypothetical protein